MLWPPAEAVIVRIATVVSCFKNILRNTFVSVKMTAYFDLRIGINRTTTFILLSRPLAYAFYLYVFMVHVKVGAKMNDDDTYHHVRISPSRVSKLHTITVGSPIEGIFIGGSAPLSSVQRALAEIDGMRGGGLGGAAAACVDMLRWFGSTQIRNVASLAGRLMYSPVAGKTRCPAFDILCTWYGILCFYSVVYMKLSIFGLPKTLRNVVMFADMLSGICKISPHRGMCVNVLLCNFRLILYRVRCLYFEQLALLAFTRCSSGVGYHTLWRLLFSTASDVSFELLCLPVPLNTDLQSRICLRTTPTLPLRCLLLA